LNTDHIAWVLSVLAVIGLVFTVLKLIDDWWNFQAVRSGMAAKVPDINRRHWWIGFASVMSSIGQLGIWLGFCVIGQVVLGFSTPAPVDRMPRNFTIIYTLIYMEFLFAAIQIWQIVVRSHAVGRVSRGWMAVRTQRRDS
jgi:hypothetical protein